MPGAQRFSIVTAVHDVARYLPDFIGSIERQTIGLDRIEIVAVDDGSNDSSLRVLERWRQQHPELVTVLTQANAGQASARNRGLDVATGDWVGFIDPDDWVVDDYLERVARFVEAHPSCSMIACNRVYWDEAEGRRRDGHPLRGLFRGDRLIDLDQQPDHFHTSAPAAVFRRDRIERLQLRFDPRIRPHFEDGHFCTRYLLDEARPTIGFLESAEYLYRRRADNTSTLQTSLTHPGRFVEVPRFGYLDVLHRAAGRFGSVPLWLQTLVLYELSWYFSAESAPNPSPTAGRGSVGHSFVEALREIRRFLDVDAIDGFRVRRYADEWRQVVLHGLTDVPWHSPVVQSSRRRVPGGAEELSYYFSGRAPAELIYDGDSIASPRFQRTRSVTYFGQQLLWERVIRVETRSNLRLVLDGAEAEIEASADDRAAAHGSPTPKIRNMIASLMKATARKSLDVLARLPPVVREFGSAWILTDDAPDGTRSAETVYRHLVANRPDINAFYASTAGAFASGTSVLQPSTAHKVLRIGSMRWRLALRHCEELISSGPGLNFPGQFRVTYVSNGAVEERNAAWLNEVRPHEIITTFDSESDAITADGSPWRFSSRQIHCLGSPSIDMIQASINASTARAEHSVIIAAHLEVGWTDLPTLLRTAHGPHEATTTTSLVHRDLASSSFERSSDDLACLAAATLVVTDDPDVAFCSAVLGTCVIRIGAYASHDSSHHAAETVRECIDLVSELLGSEDERADLAVLCNDQCDGRSSWRVVHLLTSSPAL